MSEREDFMPESVNSGIMKLVLGKDLSWYWVPANESQTFREQKANERMNDQKDTAIEQQVR
jgi:hypothetical protein